MERFEIFLAFFMLCMGATTMTYAAGKTKFEPSDGKILLIIGQDDKTVDTFVSEVGQVPGGIMMYTSIQTMEGLDDLSRDYGAGTYFTDKMIQKYPDTVIQIGLYMVDALKDTVTGKYDGNIKKLASWARKADVPIYLRIGYECDGPHNHYDPEEYIEAYRHIADKLNLLNCNNIAFVWHAHGHDFQPDLDAYYPGDDYVDWVAFSYFQQPPDMMEPVIHFAKQHKKPVMIGESTPMGIGTGLGKMSWEAWFKIYFRFIKKHKIKIISYINSNWESMPMWKGQGWEDARIEADAYVKEYWLKETSQEMYLKSSKDLFENLGY